MGRFRKKEWGVLYMMTAIRNLIAHLRNDERGLTAVEYAVLGGIIVAALIGIGEAFTGELSGAFESLIPGSPAA